MSCAQLVPGFIALNYIKRSNAVCKAIGALAGFNHVCGSRPFDDELDRRALCELLCCCIGQGRQKCVAEVLQQADGFHGFKGYFKAEVPYLDRAPVMSRNQPARATRSRPGGSRIPDVVVVKDPDLPPTLDNVQKVYEMKFPGDRYSGDIGPDSMTQQKAYKELFGDNIDPDAMDAPSCNCEERREERVLERGMAYQWERERELSLMDRVNADTAKAVAAGAGATVLGRAVQLLGGAVTALGRALGIGF